MASKMAKTIAVGATHLGKKTRKNVIKQNAIKKNQSLEYQMKIGGKLNKTISENFLLNQNSVSEFLTDIFDLMKNSEFKI